MICTIKITKRVNILDNQILLFTTKLKRKPREIDPLFAFPEPCY